MKEVDIRENYSAAVRMITDECRQALDSISIIETQELIEALYSAEKIFFIGVGRVMLSLEAIAKRWAHLGYCTQIVGNITEPAITERDILIVGSGSGESVVPVAIAKKAVSLGAKVVYIGSNMESTVSQIASLKVRIPVKTKLDLPDEIPSRQPMTSLFEQSLLLYGDAVAALIIKERHLDLKSLWHTHANLE